MSLSSDPESLIANHLIKFIKYNKNLLHLDLTQTGLNEKILWSFGTGLRRAKSLLSIHLTGNPGVSEGLKDYLFQRVRCKERVKENNL